VCRSRDVWRMRMIPFPLEPLFEMISDSNQVWLIDIPTHLKSHVISQNVAVISMWNDFPQGMHVNLHLNGTILINRLGFTSQTCDLSCETCEFCYVNLIFVFSIPSGLYIDPFELQVFGSLLSRAQFLRVDTIF
jgi:hypothetical protein